MTDEHDRGIEAALVVSADFRKRRVRWIVDHKAHEGDLPPDLDYRAETKAAIAAYLAAPPSPSAQSDGVVGEELQQTIAVAMKYAEQERKLPNVPATMEYQIGHIKAAADKAASRLAALEQEMANVEQVNRTLKGELMRIETKFGSVKQDRDRLRAAAKPFAEFAAAYDKFGIGDGHILDERVAVNANMRGIEVADLRELRRALGESDV